MTYEPVFIDWLTVHQRHRGNLPRLAAGYMGWFDADGKELIARARPTRIEGSHSTVVSVSVHGDRVYASGNFGRYGRSDNVFGYGLQEVLSICNRVVMGLGLPPFTANPCLRNSEERDFNDARVARLDITANWATYSDSAARRFIRWLQGQAKTRIRQGVAGDESVWWANTREILKFYLKASEMEKHGSEDAELIEYCREVGMVRSELGLKRRTLQEEGLGYLSECTMAKILRIFNDRTEVMRRDDRSADENILDQVPRKQAVVAAAWLKGVDVRANVSRATFFRHRKVLAVYGLDISQPRQTAVVRPIIHEVKLTHLAAPDWYLSRQAA